jgi:hypothetical protein
MADLVTTSHAVTEEQRLAYAGIWLLKKMDLRPEDGGMVVPMHLPPELGPLEDVLRELMVADHVRLNRRKQRYEITETGYAYLGRLIDEAHDLVEEFEHAEVEDVIAALRARRLDVLRARFLWEWYTGELDDLVLFQQRRGISPVEPLWAYYLVGDDFYDTMARDVQV